MDFRERESEITNSDYSKPRKGGAGVTMQVSGNIIENNVLRREYALLDYNIYVKKEVEGQLDINKISKHEHRPIACDGSTF